MEELITLNQLKEYDEEKTNKLNVRFNNVYNYVNDELNNANNSINGLNLYVGNEISNVYNYVNNGFNEIHNELNETHNNFTTLNLSATNATVTGLNVVNTVSINGVVGNNGQVLGVVNGKSEWMDIPDPIDADNFSVNNFYVNNIAKVNNYDVTAYTVIAEGDYNNLSSTAKKEPLFYLTRPNGNLYFQGYGYSPSYLPPPDYSVYVNLFKMNQSVTTHSLVLDATDVTNGFVNGSGIYGVKAGNEWNNSVSIGLNTWGDTVTTNADELYIYNASNMYNNCQSLTDTFICNPSLITNAPEGYDPMKHCTNMARTFYNCNNFNQPVTIGNNVTDMYSTFQSCKNFNQPITIPDSVTNMYSTFFSCSNFNQLITIPDSVTSIGNFTFYYCTIFSPTTDAIRVKMKNSSTCHLCL